jgi:disulfide bond formation protein DsbB
LAPSKRAIRDGLLGALCFLPLMQLCELRLLGALEGITDSRLGFHQKQSMGFARLGLSGLVIALALAGVAAAAWQSFGPVDAAGCSLTLADRIVQATTLDIRLPFLFSATANCDEANVPLLGIPFAVWSMLTFAIIALLMMIASTSTSTLFRNPSD